MENKLRIDVTPYLEGRVSNESILLYFRGERVASIPLQWEHVDTLQHPNFQKVGNRIYFCCKDEENPASYAEHCDLGWC
ncbi:DUF2553 family protein [Rubeoparvulum massiliense]|uniref:DUF2553 family protein n=1 Tax=Rubeoparvulum massiliense TaxID=1631346 RepID=UPI00065E1845|nr:DUF2553 family protein [Rubeoparvulum massiliense]